MCYWGHLGATSGPSWTNLGPSWGHLGAISGHLGTFLGHLGAKALLGCKKHCKLRVEVHLGRATLQPHASKVDFDLYFTMFFAIPGANGGGRGCVTLGAPGEGKGRGKALLRAITFYLTAWLPPRGLADSYAYYHYCYY